MLAAKPDTLSLIPRTYMTEEVNSHKLSSDYPVCAVGPVCAHTHTHTQCECKKRKTHNPPFKKKAQDQRYETLWFGRQSGLERARDGILRESPGQAEEMDQALAPGSRGAYADLLCQQGND